MSILDVPSPAILCFLNFPEMVFLREASKDSRSHFKIREMMWIMRGRLLKAVGAPSAELIMGGGFALSGFSALKFLHGTDSQFRSIYYSMNYPPPAFDGLEDREIQDVISRLKRATNLYFVDCTTRPRAPTFHEELSFDVYLPFCITVSFLNIDKKASLAIEISTRSSLNSLVRWPN